MQNLVWETVKEPGKSENASKARVKRGHARLIRNALIERARTRGI